MQAGQKYGQGKFENEEFQYEGEWEEDQMHGEGTYTNQEYCYWGTFTKGIADLKVNKILYTIVS